MDRKYREVATKSSMDWISKGTLLSCSCSFFSGPGFPTVDKRYVRSLFDSIAYRYDLLNHLLSGGIDVYWRRKAIESLRPASPKTILDIATGTGDFALAALRLKPETIVGIDISEEMLRHGRAKLRRRGVDGRITLHSGDAEKLLFEDGMFDAAIVAFGVRNFEHPDAGLREIHRVLRPGGTLVVLEFSRPRAFPFRHVYRFYFLTLLPLIGRIISRHREAYRYLPDTVMEFPDGSDFLHILEQNGFTHTTMQALTFGIASIYTGTR
jgi:demethylmenaquinone methyltransferase/2-methoxy-6-polyprenyl-1,4-benzoquinol methylase